MVLGARGFVGGHTVACLRALPGVRVLVGGRAAGNDLCADLGSVPVPVLASAVRELAVDAVVNCAGAVGGDPTALAEANARGPAVLCAALALAAPGVRLVHLGSAAEYGAGPEGVALSESAPVCPVGVYGATKLAGTLTVVAAPLDAVVLRVFNPVGPGAPAAGLPGRLAAELRRQGRDGTVRVGDLSAYRDFVDVRDVARAAVLAVTAPGTLPRLVNVAAGRAVPVRELVRQLASAAGFRGALEESGAVSARSGGVGWQRADITLAARALGWRPRIPLTESVRDLWCASAPRVARGVS
nr:NAD(P)-dependent oxidoreductase [Streptomyces sp. SID5468]